MFIFGGGKVSTTWVTTYTAGSTGAQGGRSGYGIVNVYSAAELTQTGTKTRITFRNASGGGTHTIDSCYIGFQAASGDAYDAHATDSWVQVLVSGSGSFTIATGSDTVTDELDFALDETRAIVLAMKVNTGSTTNSTFETGTAASNYDKASATDTATRDKTSYAAGNNGRLYVTKIEVFQ